MFIHSLSNCPPLPMDVVCFLPYIVDPCMLTLISNLPASQMPCSIHHAFSFLHDQHFSSYWIIIPNTCNYSILKEKNIFFLLTFTAVWWLLCHLKQAFKMNNQLCIHFITSCTMFCVLPSALCRNCPLQHSLCIAFSENFHSLLSLHICCCFLPPTSLASIQYFHWLFNFLLTSSVSVFTRTQPWPCPFPLLFTAPEHLIKTSADCLVLILITFMQVVNLHYKPYLLLRVIRCISHSCLTSILSRTLLLHAVLLSTCFVKTFSYE